MGEFDDWATKRAEIIVAEEIRAHGFPDGTDDLRRIVRGTLLGAPDDPRLDGTDFAHPAYWRGQDEAIRAVCVKLLAAIDGSDNGGGVMGDPRVERIRRWILAKR